MTPQEAFARLKKDGAFGESVNGCHIHWYWHQLGKGYKIMARQNLDGFDRAPELFHAFFIKDEPLTPKRYF